MTLTTTQNDIIQYVYRETSVEDSERIENALILDSGLREFYNSVKETAASVLKARKSPRPSVSERILNYSKNYKLQSIDQH